MPLGIIPPNTPVIIPLTWATGPNNSQSTDHAQLILTLAADGTTASGHVRFIGYPGGTGAVLAEQDWDLSGTNIVSLRCPDDTVMTELTVSQNTGAVGWALDAVAK